MAQQSPRDVRSVTESRLARNRWFLLASAVLVAVCAVMILTALPNVPFSGYFSLGVALLCLGNAVLQRRLLRTRLGHLDRLPER